MRAEQFARARPRLATVDAVQCGVILKILRDRQIEVERTRLEHHAHAPQRLAGIAPDVVTEDADVSGLHAEQPRDQ